MSDYTFLEIVTHVSVVLFWATDGFGLADFDVVFYPDGLAGHSEKLQTRLLNIQI